MCHLLIIAALALSPAFASAEDKRYGDATLAQWQMRLADFDAASPRAAAAVPALAEILADDEVDTVTRRAAALALGRIGKPARSALPLLIEMAAVQGDHKENEAAWAIKALSLLGPHAKEAAPTLAAIALHERRPLAVRQLSLEALARIGGAHPEAISALIAVVQLSPRGDDSDVQQNELRLLAVEALGVVGPDGAVAAPLLARILRSPRESEALRRRSAESLAAFGPAARFALDALAETLIGDDDEAVRDAAAKALGAMGEAAREQVAQLLVHEDAGVRWRAAQTLGTMGEAGKLSLDPLQQIAGDKEEEGLVRLHAAGAIWKISADAQRVSPTAIALLTSDDRMLRVQALDLLVALGPPAPSAVAQLRELTQHDRREVRQIAEQALRKLAPPP